MPIIVKIKPSKKKINIVFPSKFYKKTFCDDRKFGMNECNNMLYGGFFDHVTRMDEQYQYNNRKIYDSEDYNEYMYERNDYNDFHLNGENGYKDNYDDCYGNNYDEKLYGTHSDYEDYYDSIYN